MYEHPSKDQLLLDRLNEAIENNLQNEQFGVPEIAKAAGLSRSQLNRKLQSLTNQSASQFIREYRLKKALELLQSNTATTSEVSYMVGFGSPAYFSTSFKDFYGYPPSKVKYRNDGSENTQSPIKWKALLLTLAGMAILTSAYWIFNNYSTEKKQSIIRIAVLPVKDYNSDSSLNQYPNIITEDISDMLSKFSEFDIIGSSFTENIEVPSIGTELDADFLLEVSFSNVADSTRLNVKLSNSKNGSIILSETHRQQLDDVLNIQHEVVMTIAERLGVRVTENERKLVNADNIDQAAYGFYLKGSDYLSRRQSEENMRDASNLFEKAIAIDSGFAKAWIGLASANQVLYSRHYDRSITQFEKVKKYHEKAKSLNPELLVLRLRMTNELGGTEALQTLQGLLKEYPNNDTIYKKIGGVYRSLEQYEKALEYLEKAIELNPANSHHYTLAGAICSQLRRYNKGLEYYQMAKNLEPSLSVPRISTFYLMMGDVEKAREYITQLYHKEGGHYLFRSRVEQMDRNFEKCLNILEEADSITSDYASKFRVKSLELGLIYYMMQDIKSAKMQFQIARDILEKKLDLIEFHDDPRILGSLGIAYAGLGMKQEAIEAGNKAISSQKQLYFRIYDLAQIYLMNGAFEKSIQQLEKVVQRGRSVETLKLDPFWDPLKEKKAFKALVNNPEYQPIYD